LQNSSYNPNVFYELGIAHATQPISRQVLIANKGYKAIFDTKHLIYYEYEENLSESILPLAERIADSIKTQKIQEERMIHQARMGISPYGFEVMMTQGIKPNFVLHTSPKGRQDYEDELLKRINESHLKGCSEHHIQGITNLCTQGILGFNTDSKREGGKVIVSFSYHWTDLGNCVLYLLQLIDLPELERRRQSLPAHFA